MKRFLAVLGALLSVVYLINPTLGVFELIPDNLPIVGNIDEAAITALLIACLRTLGLDVMALFSKKEKRDKGEVIDVES